MEFVQTAAESALMSQNKKNGGKQASAQRHAEGEHGQKTTEFLRKQHAEQTGSASSAAGPRHDPAEINEHDTPGKRGERQAGAKHKGS